MGLLLSHSHLPGENNSPQSAFYTDRFENGELKYMLACRWLCGSLSYVDTQNRSVSPATENLALFMQILRLKNHCLVLSTNMHGSLVTWLQGPLKRGSVRKWMHKKPCSRSEIQFLTLIRGMVVLNNYLRFQESLPLIFYNVRVNRSCACFVSLFPIAEVAHFCTCKLAKQRRISSQMVSRWSHGVEVQYNRWNHYKVETLHTCAIFQAPSWFLLLGPRLHSTLRSGWSRWGWKGRGTGARALIISLCY